MTRYWMAWFVLPLASVACGETVVDDASALGSPDDESLVGADVGGGPAPVHHAGGEAGAGNDGPRAGVGGAIGTPDDGGSACLGLCEAINGERVCHPRACDPSDDRCGPGATCVEFGRLWSPGNCGPVPCLPIFEEEAVCVPVGYEACVGEGACGDGSTCVPLETCACNADGTVECVTDSWKRVCEP